MSKKKTHEEFVKEIYNIYKNEYTVIGQYINAKTKIEIKHNICNHIFKMEPGNILSGQQCPYCKNDRISKLQLITTNEFKKEIFDLVGNEYSVKSEYKGRGKKVLFTHNICNYDFWMTPSHFIHRGQRCTNPACLHDRISKPLRKTTEKFLEDFEKRSKGEYKLLSLYTLSREKISIQHLVCGNIFSMCANNFLLGCGCPYCNISKGEKRIKEYCNEHKISYIWQKTFDDLLGTNNGLLSYDFYIPNSNLLIEYQGEYHDGSLVGKCQTEEKFEIQKEHDKKKKEYAESHNIELLEIWYWDFDNIEKILEKELAVKAA